MSNKKSFCLYSLFAVAASILFTFSYITYAYADDDERSGNTGGVTPNEDLTISEESSGGNSCVGSCQDETVATSRKVFGTEIKATDFLNDTAFSDFVDRLPEVSTSSTGEPLFQAVNNTASATAQSLVDADPSATLYMSFAYANKDGYLYVTDPETGNRVKTWFNKDDIIGVKRINDGSSWGANGVKAADAAQKGAEALAKIGINMDNVKTMSVAELTAIWDHLVATGAIKGYDNNFFFHDLHDPKFQKLTDKEKAEIIEVLCEMLGGCDGEPDPPDGPIDDRCHLENYWGDTIGEVSVQNLTTGTGWQTGEAVAATSTSESGGAVVWARPGDTVQFKTYYCWGAEAVYADDYKYARTEYWAGADNIYFQLSAKRNDNYLFGENAQFIGSKKHILSSPHKETIGSATDNEVPDSKVDVNGSYDFILYSPGQKDGSNYNCQIFDFAAFTLDQGYQIPGVYTGGCAAISMNGGNKSDVDNQPGSISQSITYDEIQAWQLYKYEKSGSCAGCNYDDRGNVTDSRTADDRNSLKRKNTNIFDDPFPDLSTAKTATGNTWGIVTKHKDDTEEHEHDCDSKACGCNKWHHLVTNGCTKCKDDDCKIKVLEDCYLECGVDESGASCINKPGLTYSESKAPTYTEHKGKDIHPINNGTKTSTASVNIPYSYKTAAQTRIAAGEVIYLGETVDSTFTVNIIPRIVKEVRPNEAYATLVDGSIQAVEFITSGYDIPSGGGVAPVSVQGNDLCNYFPNSDCEEIWREGPKLNKEGRYRGANYSHNETRVVPDDNEDLVGKKYCVAVGISTADSHGVITGHNGVTDDNIVSGMSNPSAWRVSNLACRTIAKKPNFQVWNGGLYTNGSIKTSATYKNVGASLGGSKDPTGVFGSWDEYYVVAAGEVRNFASAAALGYDPSLRPRGGKAPGDLTSYCDATKETISNVNCDKGISGKSNITNTSQNIILERIRTRYALGGSNTDYYGTELDEGGARYIYKQSDDISISEIVKKFSDTEMSNKNSSIYNCNKNNNSKGALKMCQGQSANSEQTTSNYADGTLVIHTGGKVTIDRNICYGAGDCSNSNTVKLANNSETFTSMYGLPQVLIIADGGIDITDNVSQIDAWLITNGTVDTCAGYRIGSVNSEQCKNTLIVNGPVFAKSMDLNRTAGAYPGSGSASGTVLTRNLSEMGSITAAEIFNLRPDTLYWAYSQAQRFTQATVTYTRELAPRY